ncbi:MAG TPA: hypothetical protein VNJ01_08135 [Bacteriovoracaceae bacterium]|nr:hypothetical protein [Bacteriovoracaceae bacterium]
MRFVTLFILLIFSLPGLCQEAEPYNANYELKKIGYRALDVSALLDPKVIRILIRAMEETSLHEVPKAEMRKLILSKTKDDTFKAFLAKYPKILDIMVDLLRDRRAMPNFLSILLRKKDLELFLLACLGVLILGILVEKFLFPKSWTSFQKFVMDTTLSFAMGAVTTTLFYKMFQAELSPTLEIIKFHL